MRLILIGLVLLGVFGALSLRWARRGRGLRSGRWRRCPHCGLPSRGGVTYCPHCGQVIRHGSMRR